MKKKRLFIILAVALCAVLSITLAACGEGNGGGTGGGNGGGNGGSSPVVMNKTELVAFSTASMGSILQTMNTPAAATAASEAADPAPETAPESGNATAPVANPNDPTPEQIEKINQQIAIFENFISGNPVQTVEGESDRAAYAKMMTITTTDMAGVQTVYVLYYNETLTAEETEEEDGVIETEQEFALEGKLVIGENEYDVRGEKELEEGEYEMKIKAMLDAQNFIEFEQEIEADEQEFKYTIHKNGAVVSRFAIEIENEDGEQSIEMKNLDAASGTNVKFKKEIENGKTFIKIDMIENGVKTTMKVFVTTDEQGQSVYRYQFQSGGHLDFDRDKDRD